MNIAILGANGFVGSNLAKFCASKYSVTKVTRTDLDLLDYHSVTEFLTQYQFDVVICCAASMDNTVEDVRNNFGMFLNFYQNANLFGKFINTASGAEYDRSRDINSAQVNEIFLNFPKDSYGLGQNMRSRLAHTKENFYNLRIFNCFGPGEISTRIFPKFLESHNGFDIVNNRYFDYFSIKDLCAVTDYFICNTPPMVRDINCVYKEKYKISEVLGKFNSIHNLGKNITVKSTSNNNYTGDHSLLYSLPIQLTGLEQGLKDYI